MARRRTRAPLDPLAFIRSRLRLVPIAGTGDVAVVLNSGGKTGILFAQRVGPASMKRAMEALDELKEWIRLVMEEAAKPKKKGKKKEILASVLTREAK